MPNFSLRPFRLAAVSLGALIALSGGAPALAASVHPSKVHHGGGGSTGGTTGSSTTGFDVSYPQCGASLPTSPAFVIVGLNDGLANNLNPCFGPTSSYPSYTQSELYWAAQAAGGTSQPKVSVYVNTGDPGNSYNGKPIADWPQSSSGSDPYGSCTTTTFTSNGTTYKVGANSQACAWQYGSDRATHDVTWLSSEAGQINAQAGSTVVATSAPSYTWWLDVETGNSWQTNTGLNVADLRGMTDALIAAGVTTTGVYSTSYQWNTIAGSSLAGSLVGLPDWIPGASSSSGAQSNCGRPSFTAGRVVLTQWVAGLDNDYSCV